MNSYESLIDYDAWRIAADTLPALIFTALADGSIEFLNRRWTEESGVDPGLSVDAAWRSLIHPEDVGRMTALRFAASNGADHFNFPLRRRRTDGTYDGLHCSAAALRDDGGAIVRWYGVAAHTEAEKQAGQKSRGGDPIQAESNQRFRVLAETIPVISWTADANGWIDWYNRRWYEYTGQGPDEAQGWGWQAAHHPDDFLDVMRRWPHSIASGERFEMEYRLRRHDGVYRWFLARAEPLRDESGTIVRWYGSSVDIDAQKQALERSKRVAETLQAIFLPKRLPHRPDVRIDAVYLPAEKDDLIGGDWFDAFELDDGRLVLTIGDVAGHGLQASVVAGLLRQALFTLAFTTDDPAAILKEANRILIHQEPDTIATALVAIVDKAHSSVTYASAGHPPPIVAYANDRPAESFACGGPPLGTGPNLDVSAMAIPIRQDAVLALYTDGMIEFGRNVIEAEAKMRAAVALLVGNTTIARPAIALQEIVFDDMPARDDAALLIVQFSAVDVAALASKGQDLDRTWRFHSSDAHAAHAVRQEIAEFLRASAADQDDAFAAELVLGEIIANTVEHAPGLVDVHLDWTFERPMALVRDSGPGFDSMQATLPNDAMAEGGRGMFLIKSMAAEATATRSSDRGTSLRVTLPVRRKRHPLGPRPMIES